MRIRLDLGYDGTDFSGWAAQPGRRTVQGEVTAALAMILQLDPPPVLTCAGRTDAGVHARGQVAHVDIPEEMYARVAGRSDRDPAVALATRLRGVLPRDITVRGTRVAPEGFDARFSATSRRYRYMLCDDPAYLDPLAVRTTVLHPRPLDVHAMASAATHLLGLRDFAPFCRRRDGASTIRTLLRYEWERVDAGVLEATVVADAFCHSMVRALVGAVVPVGEGRMGPDFPAQVLRSGVRHARVQVMPAHGLVLEEVTYPADADLAARAKAARRTRRREEIGSSGSELE